MLRQNFYKSRNDKANTRANSCLYRIQKYLITK